jgi:hypothetical protein
MEKQSINLIGGGFQHSPSTSGYDPLYITWVRNNSAPLSIYVDDGLQKPTNPHTKNYGWLCESKTINGGLYQWCLNNLDYLKNKFIFVFTHDVELAKQSDVFKLVQCSGKSFIDYGEIYTKTKLVSMIASNKIMCEEHKFRGQIINKFSGKCDHYGRGYNEIKNKIDGLKDYCFSFAMENATYSNMFTEKITDCFMCGTIPIYYGMSNIGEIFNEDGIIRLTDDFKIEDISFDLYYSKINAVNENFKIANELLTAEDYIYLNHIKNEI